MAVVNTRNLPCLNPSCHSHGAPHPNCRCYEATPMLAEGGSVEHYCSTNRPHSKDCQYFADGGAIDNTPQIQSEGISSAPNIVRSNSRIDKHVGMFFKPWERYEHRDMSTAKEKLKKSIAAGGPFQDDSDVSTAGPQAGTTSGDVYNYLNATRPSPPPGLPFDAPTRDKAAEKSYERALGVAVDPLSVLGHAHNGNLLPEHVQHLQGMYPQLKDHLAKKLTEGVVKAQLSGTKPAYKSRQGLSLLLGASLDSSTTPASIQAAQGTFQPQGGPPGSTPPRPTKKGGKSADKLAAFYQTGAQASEARAGETD